MSNFDRNVSNAWGGAAAQTAAGVDQGLRAYMLGVYNYMVLGLAITGLAALGANMLAVASPGSQAVARLGGIPLTSFGMTLYASPLRWVVMLAPLAFVFFFSFRVDKMSAATARGVYFAFAAVMGLSLSSILLVYAGESVVKVFFITSAAFASLSLFGYTTKRDLSAFGAFLIMGLFGLIIASVVNLYMQSSGMQWALSVISILIFSGLTAWDTQSIKEMYYEGDGHEVMTKKSVNGALMLYLDFINIFQSLLSLMGNRNN